ncbi:MAG: hypothetical protein AB1485_04595 [Candidatus Thermoplasmatota archaeon]
MENKEKATEVMSVRVTKPLKKVIEQYLRLDTHISVGDLIRDALREKIRRDAPHLYKELFEKESRGQEE